MKIAKLKMQTSFTANARGYFLIKIDRIGEYQILFGCIYGANQLTINRNFQIFSGFAN